MDGTSGTHKSHMTTWRNAWPSQPGGMRPECSLCSQRGRSARRDVGAVERVNQGTRSPEELTGFEVGFGLLPGGQERGSL